MDTKKTAHHVARRCTSFSMTAMRRPWFCLRSEFSKVVLPEPKKPVMICTKR